MPLDRKAVFFDRDGTLMEEEDHCDHPSRVRSIAGAAEGLRELRRLGWLNIVITNQSGIGRGYFTIDDYESVNAELFRQLDHTIDAAYFCPDHPDTPTPRRKPGIGMLEDAVREHGVDLAQSWLVGDKAIDIACGQAGGCRTILVLTGYGQKTGPCQPDFVAPTITEAIQIILSQKS